MATPIGVSHIIESCRLIQDAISSFPSAAKEILGDSEVLTQLNDTITLITSQMDQYILNQEGLNLLSLSLNICKRDLQNLHKELMRGVCRTKIFDRVKYAIYGRFEIAKKKRELKRIEKLQKLQEEVNMLIAADEQYYSHPTVWKL